MVSYAPPRSHEKWYSSTWIRKHGRGKADVTKGASPTSPSPTESCSHLQKQKQTETQSEAKRSVGGWAGVPGDRTPGPHPGPARGHTAHVRGLHGHNPERGRGSPIETCQGMATGEPSAPDDRRVTVGGQTAAAHEDGKGLSADSAAAAVRA
ncbi:hypothetical protein L226DRAFT_263896 [Lentinus tigrinus ALCF2SS1-7]|uniref:uncharacterized protein n=1 Tax=Lentinus tigrinus ALCF2SS1-7 TaxID=1328758 RepID=UPI0011663001|nr:hypothetical protein L226DRAFT_263896 [Lentinus tigrinus ALCF2SS1-7]